MKRVRLRATDAVERLLPVGRQVDVVPLEREGAPQ